MGKTEWGRDPRSKTHANHSSPSEDAATFSADGLSGALPAALPGTSGGCPLELYVFKGKVKESCAGEAIAGAKIFVFLDHPRSGAAEYAVAEYIGTGNAAAAVKPLPEAVIRRSRVASVREHWPLSEPRIVFDKFHIAR
jgi:hypothetical protein